MIVRVVALLLALLACAQATAHTRSQSHSSWTIDGPNVRTSFSVADTEAVKIARDGRRPDDAALLAYLTPRLGVTAGDTRCRSVARPRMLSAAAGFRRMEFQYLCPSADGLRLIDTAFFDLIPTHINFAQVQRPDGDFVEQLITADDQGLELADAGGNRLSTASFAQFMGMGIMHIFTGIDHIAFLVGLVLISRRTKDLVFVVTGFTLGHSLTLALAVTGIIRPHAEFIDALVALTIALIGAENIGVASKRPVTVAVGVGLMLAAMAALRFFGIGLLPPLLLIGATVFAVNYLLISGQLRDAGRLRLVVTLVFGLIHGFGFAADLLESRLPTEKLAEILVGFNLGVEAGQLTIVLALTGVVALLRRYRLALPRALVVDVAAAALVGVGTFWFVGRSFA